MNKLKWLKQVNKQTEEDLPRPPEPLLGGTTEFFVGSVVPMVEGMKGVITNHNTLTRLLNNNYTKKLLSGWAVAELSIDEARAELLARQQRQVTDKVFPPIQRLLHLLPVCIVARVICAAQLGPAPGGIIAPQSMQVIAALRPTPFRVSVEAKH